MVGSGGLRTACLAVPPGCGRLLLLVGEALQRLWDDAQQLRGSCHFLEE